MEYERQILIHIVKLYGNFFFATSFSEIAFNDIHDIHTYKDFHNVIEQLRWRGLKSARSDNSTSENSISKINYKLILNSES